MSGKHLLEELGRLAREEDVMSDPRWDALAAGTATPEEEAELRALADRSPEARAAYEALRPIDEAAMDRLVEDVSRKLQERAPVPRPLKAGDVRWRKAMKAFNRHHATEELNPHREEPNEHRAKLDALATGREARSDERPMRRRNPSDAAIHAAFGVAMVTIGALAVAVVTSGLRQGEGARAHATSAWSTPVLLAALLVIAGILLQVYRSWRRTIQQLSESEERIVGMALLQQQLVRTIAIWRAEDKKKGAQLEAMEEELRHYRAELKTEEPGPLGLVEGQLARDVQRDGPERPRAVRRRVYRILTLGMKATGKTSLTLRWLNPVVGEGTKIERRMRYERCVSREHSNGFVTEHLFEVHDYDHIVDALQEVIVEEFHGLLFVVDLGGRDAQQIDAGRVSEQLQEFEPQALRHFFGPKTQTCCKTVVLFINKSDLASGTLAEVERQAWQLYRPLIDNLVKYAEKIDLRIFVGSARSGHSTQQLFAHLVERLLPEARVR